MTSNNELTKRERKSLLIGVAMGILGGMIANLWTNFYFKFMDLSTNSNFWFIASGLVISTISIVIIVIVLIRDIKKMKD